MEDLLTIATQEELDCAIEDKYGVLYSRDGSKLLKCRNSILQCYEINDGTKVICKWAFRFCKSLRHVIIPDSVITIGAAAFMGCDSLKEISIPNSVMNMDAGVFYICKNLESVKLSTPADGLDFSTFDGCKSLRQIIIPEGSEERFKMKIDSMWDCVVTEVFENKAIEETGGNLDEFGVMYSKDGKSLLKCENMDLERYEIKNGTVLICDKAFWGCRSLKKISIPDSVTTIGDFAFRNCAMLQQVTIPKAVTTLGIGAFQGCFLILQIIIDGSVKYIQKRSFKGCRFLKQIILPDSVSFIDEEAFQWCDDLEQIVVPDGCIQKFKMLLPEVLQGKLCYMKDAKTVNLPPETINDLPF